MHNMHKDASITFRVPQATRDALERAAAADRRSLSNLLLAVVTDYLERDGGEQKPPRARAQARRRA